MNVSRCKTKTVVLTLECLFTNANGPVPRKDPTKSYSVACAPGMGDGAVPKRLGVFISRPLLR